jgi:hypothetical protein
MRCAEGTDDQAPDALALRRPVVSEVGQQERKPIVVHVRISDAGRKALTRRDHQPGLGPRRLRWAAGILIIVAFALVAVAALRSIRVPVLEAVGWVLVADEPVGPADIIVVSLDSGGAGALEAADLVQDGIAKQVAVFADPPSGEDWEFIRRGLPYEDASAGQIRQLRSLGVTDILRISRPDPGTTGEGQVLPAWCDQHDLRSIVFVAARDHSRRTKRVLDRVMRDHSTRVTVKPARYSSFDPERWWETRNGVRTAIVELQKLMFDILIHPT